jgi:hypothetical protein
MKTVPLACTVNKSTVTQKLNGTGANSANTGLVDSVPKWGEKKCSFVTTVNRLGYLNCHCLPMLHKYATLVIFVMF